MRGDFGGERLGDEVVDEFGDGEDEEMGDFGVIIWLILKFYFLVSV